MSDRPHLFSQLRALAARVCGDAAVAEDVVQEALLAAVRAGRADLSDEQNGRWLHGVVKNQARMNRRGTARSLRRDTAWQEGNVDPEPAAPADDVLTGLPPTLRVVAALVLTGHNREEIAYLLRITDAAPRQRIVALKARLREAGLSAPEELTALDLDLAFGKIREALLPRLQRHGGEFATHDPDGHLFVVRRSQKP